MPIALATTFSEPAAPSAFDVHLSPGTNGTGSFSVSIATEKAGTTAFAPHPVFMEASVTNSGVTAGSAGAYDPQATDITYVWKITKDGDAGYLTETYNNAGRVNSSNATLGWAYKHVKMGKRIAHSFDSPGTYRVICTAIVNSDRNKATSSQATITVTNADDYFSAPQTYTVGSGEEYSTVQAAWNAMVTDNPTRARISLKRGSTGLGDLATGGAGPTSTAEILIDAFGTGAKPQMGSITLGTSGTDYGSNTTDFRVSGISVGDASEAALYVSGMQGAVFVADDVQVRPGHGLYRESADGNGANMWRILSNCDNSAYTGYGVLLSAGRAGEAFAMIGCKSRMDTTLLTSEAGGAGYNVRTTGQDWLQVMSQCDLFQRTSNSFSSSDPTQPGNRFGWNTPRATTAPYWQIDRVIQEGNLFGDAPSDVDSISAVFENILEVKNNDGFGGFISTIWSGITIRNVVSIKSPSRRDTTAVNGTDQPLSLRLRRWIWVNDAATHTGDPFKVYSNTFVNLMDDTTDVYDGLLIDNVGTITVVNANNIDHSPYQALNGTDAGSFDNESLFDVLFTAWEDLALGSTSTPTHVLDVTTTTGFSEGNTLYVGTTRIGVISQAMADENLLWLTDVDNSVSNGANLAISSGGATVTTAASASRFSGAAATWTPSSAPGNDASGVYAPIDLFGVERAAQQRGAVYVAP